MTHRLLKAAAWCVVGVLTFAACGDDSEGDSASDDDAAVEETSGGGDDAEAAEETEAPVETAATVDILTDFGDVCRGVSLPGATPYDPARSGIHPLMTAVGEDPTYDETLALLPDQWDPVVGEEQTVELVVCLNRTSATLVQTCDGYLDDNDEDTGKVVEVYDTVYDVRLIAATSGEVVATTTVQGSDDLCPSFVFFDEDQTVKPWYAEPTDELTAFLAPYVET